jgi:hypothetical protein
VGVENSVIGVISVRLLNQSLTVCCEIERIVPGRIGTIAEARDTRVDHVGPTILSLAAA